ncbi:hypothetical protein [Mesomycoplasma lagogenitalium]|uniref:Uncharacterized protein n=1 Tax=Mesomycoplasma lagogenitalium TaxID=171286 RepID=A0ABY8LW57_9BACT|nr:hypothetical protein [Mesomycoplasma lagogenitalium]WGI36476.1 hypothetical protein QEG99_03355 [Mesomycoplasma lagogenitalium]
MARILYKDKRNFTNTIYDEEEKREMVSAEDMNEIKTVVNQNVNEIETIKRSSNNLSNEINSINQRINRSQVIRYHTLYNNVERTVKQANHRDRSNTNSITIPFSAFVLNPGEYVDYYILAITPQLNRSWDDFGSEFINSTVRFIIEPNERSRDTGVFSDRLRETQSLTTIAETGRDHTVITFSINAESSGLHLKIYESIINSGSPQLDGIKIKYSLIAKIVKL